MPTARLDLHLFGLFRLLQGDRPVAGLGQARLIAGYGAENNHRIRWKIAMSNECPWHSRDTDSHGVTELHDPPA